MFTEDILPLDGPKNDRLGVLGSTLPVVQETDRVVLHGGRIRAIAVEWAATPWPTAGWDLALHFFDGTARTLNWMALIDALNFCFWGDVPPGVKITKIQDPAQFPRWRVRWHDHWHDGYAALAVALRRATEAGAAAVGGGVPGGHAQGDAGRDSAT